MSDRPRAFFRATVQYDGTAFHGWQSQPDRRTVQDELEAALARILGLGSARGPADDRDRDAAGAPDPADAPDPAGASGPGDAPDPAGGSGPAGAPGPGVASDGRHSPRITAAGRTDAGVHACGQEVAFAAPDRWEPDGLRRALNAVAPDDVWIERLARTDQGFHPRFDATGRRYEYFVGVRPDAASPLRGERIWPLCRPVDRERLETATAELPGERSFEAFAKAGQPERGVRCRVEEAAWTETAQGDLAFLIVADRFLHHMVRYLVSTLVEVGTGRREPDEVRRLLESGADDGPDGGPRPPAPAPAGGLYLTGVRYPDGWNRPAGVPGLTRAGSPGDRGA